MTHSKCSECYENQPRFWRDQPMNQVIRERATFQKHANQFYYTLDQAMSVWGTEINDDSNHA